MTDPTPDPAPTPVLAPDVDSAPPPFAPVRALAGGFLMGLANLVPGVSGGTMILALGLYDRFIGAIADVTRLRREPRSFLFLALLVVGALVCFALLSGVAVQLVAEQRWVMYSLFVGMTLGGVPDLWKQCKPFGARVAIGAPVGFGAMVLLAYGLQSTPIPVNTPVLVGIGALAASSMILPGVSGSYLLLIFGMYEVVVGSISEVLRGDRAEGLAVLVPVGVGAVLGIALLSNVLKILLARAPRASHAVLLGLLCGSVIGLWPFQDSAYPELADRDDRKAVERVVDGAPAAEVREEFGVDWTDAHVAHLRERFAGDGPGDLKRKSIELTRFTPDGGRVAIATLLLLVGVGLTRLLGRGGPAAHAPSRTNAG